MVNYYMYYVMCILKYEFRQMLIIFFQAVENLIKTMAMLIKLKNNNIANFYSYEQTVTEITFCMEYVSGVCLIF